MRFMKAEKNVSGKIQPTNVDEPFTLQIRKLSPRERKHLGQGHTVY